MKFLFLILFASLFFNSSCSTDANFDVEPVPFEVLRGIEGVALRGPFISKCELNNATLGFDSQLKENLSDIELKITNTTDFQKFIICEDSINIDFNSEFLLAGRTKRPSSPISFYQQNVVLKKDTLIYFVGFVESFVHLSRKEEYIVKVLSKKYSDYPVSFNVYWKEFE